MVTGFSVDHSGTWSVFLVAGAALVIMAAWTIFAASRFVQGGVVERGDRIPQLYGYTVCLVSLLWALASGIGVVSSGLSLSSPLHYRRNEFGFDPAITSFEAFRLTYDRARRFSGGDPDAAIDSIPEAQLRQRFEVYRADRIEANRVSLRQDLVTRTLSLILAVLVFAFHWRWLRRRNGGPATAP